MSKNKRFEKKWLDLFYTRVGDQFILSRNSLHNTHQWVITLALGLITAVLTLGSNTNSYPNEYGFLALLISFPLLFRFFVRSCLETSIQYKWMTIRNALDKYYFLSNHKDFRKQKVEDYLEETIILYYFDWKSPNSIWKIIWDNIRLAYFWPFIVLISLIIWGYFSLPFTFIITISTIVVGVYIIYEVSTFFTYRGFDFEETTTPDPDITNPIKNE